MALSGLNFGMSVTWVDNGGNTAVREYMMKNEIATYDDAAAAAATMITKLVPMSNAVISQYRVFQVFTETAFSLPTDPGVQVEDRASMTYQLAGAGNKKANLNIPAPVIGLFSGISGPQANVIDINDAAVSQFAAQFLPASDFRMSDGEAATRILNGRRVHSKSSRG